MLTVKTKVESSNIHGVGLFADEFIPVGTIIWQWHDGIDQQLPVDVVHALPSASQEFIRRYGWMEDGNYIICIDNEKFINHSDNPNCVFIEDGNSAVASRDIHVGEEITQDYRQFDDNFGVKEFGYDW